MIMQLKCEVVNFKEEFTPNTSFISSIKDKTFKLLHEKFPSQYEFIAYSLIIINARIESLVTNNNRYIFPLFTVLLITILIICIFHLYVNKFQHNNSILKNLILNNFKNSANNHNEFLIIQIINYIFKFIFSIIIYIFGIILHILNILSFNCLLIDYISPSPQDSKLIPFFSIIKNISYILIYIIIMYAIISLSLLGIIGTIHQFLEWLIVKKYIKNKTDLLIVSICILIYILYIIYIAILVTNSIFFRDIKTDFDILKFIFQNYNISFNDDNIFIVILKTLFIIIINPFIFFIECIISLITIKINKDNSPQTTNGNFLTKIYNFFRSIFKFILQLLIRMIFIILFICIFIVYMYGINVFYKQHQIFKKRILCFNTNDGKNVFTEEKIEQKIPITI